MDVFTVSTLVYVVVNVLENLVHYNIGKHTGHRFHITRPSLRDATRMAGVMLAAALLQGFLVSRVMSRAEKIQP
jgi:hypothetical protein